MAAVVVRYYAGAAAAAGGTSEDREAEAVEDLLASLVQDKPGRLEKILASASILVDGTVVRDRTAKLHDGQTVDVLPPFAGG